jgi:hypothetical protein
MDLKDAVEKYQDAEFQYGVLDCFLFVCNIIRDVTGVDHAAPWRGKYHSEIGALRQMAVHGGFIEAVSSAFGELHPIWVVKAGDPVLIASPLVDDDAVSQAVGIYDGAVVQCLTESGLYQVPVMSGRGCWHV